MQHSILSAVANPFPLQAGLDAVFAHPAWQRARAAALETLQGGGSAVLVGLPGSGKSLLLRELDSTLWNAGRLVWLSGPADAPGRAAPGEIHLVDEADTFGANALKVLCAGTGPLLLAGLPGFPQRLPKRMRTARCIVLDPLSPQDVARFVVARLAAAGQPGLFEPEAVLALARLSGGLPRLVNVLGGGAVFLAGLEGATRVSQGHVEEAAAMRGGPVEDAPSALADVPHPAAPDLVMPNFRSPVLRRRAALGSMVAASGVLLALPWFLGRGRGVQPATIQLAQADPAAVPAMTEPRTPAPPGIEAAPSPATTPQPAAVAAPPAPQHGVDTAASDGPVRFHGPIFNETMGQGGQVTLVIRRQAPGGAITARFDASQGLSGSGVLAGTVSGAGRITASGQLLMGRNPFMCDLSGTLTGSTLTGSANFARSGNGAVFHSRFSLVRA